MEGEKDRWDKFGIVTQFISGVVIAVVGGVFTYSYQSQQAARERQAADVQRVQTIGTFMPFLTSKDAETKQLALTQVQSLLGTRNAVAVALQVNAASQANPSTSAPGDEGAKPDPAVASALQVIVRRADTDSDRQLAADALKQITCGRERWDVKTLSDAGAPPAGAPPRDSSIAQLVAMERPSSLAPDARDQIERTAFKVTARFVSVKQEPDRDYRLVISDESGKTMIAEIPSPDCYKGGESSVAAKFADARKVVEQLVGVPPARDVEPPRLVQVEVVGIAFFDFLHGQHGMAPNGIELHPVLSLRVLDSSGSP